MPHPKNESAAIAERLVTFRKHLRYTQAELAEITEIRRESLASYESGRVPVLWQAGVQLARKTGLSLLWLAEGTGEEIWPVPEAALNAQFPRRMLLASAVRDLLASGELPPLPPVELQTAIELLGSIREQTDRACELGQLLVNHLRLKAPKVLEDLARDALFRDLRGGVVHNVSALFGILGEVGDDTRVAWPDSEEKTLTSPSRLDIVADVPMDAPNIDKLMDEVKDLTTPPKGSRRSLMDFLRANSREVSRQRLSNWLCRHANPDAETTLLILRWVTGIGRK